MPSRNNIEALMRARAMQQGYNPQTGIYDPMNPLPDITTPMDAPWRTAQGQTPIPQAGQAGPPGGNMPVSMGGRGPAAGPLGGPGGPGGGAQPIQGPPTGPNAAPVTGPQGAPNTANQVAAAMRANAAAMGGQGHMGGPGHSGDIGGEQVRSPNSGRLTPGDEKLVRESAPNQEQFAQGVRAGNMADQMRLSSMENVEGKMVGNIYVPASIAQHGAKLVEAFVSARKEKEQKELRGESAKKTGANRWDWLKGMDTDKRAKIMFALERPDA